MKLLNSDVTDDIGGVSVGSVLLHLVFASIHGPELLAGESGHHGSTVGVTQHVGGGAAAVAGENIYSGLEERERYITYTNQSTVQRRETSWTGALMAVRTMIIRTRAALGTEALATLAAVEVSLQ